MEKSKSYEINEGQGAELEEKGESHQQPMLLSYGKDAAGTHHEYDRDTNFTLKKKVSI